ncbi:hypothetical protein OH491_06745 [Termitidicoccus mucosus]|uniref:hypothetical protein n=1 Tax=Termitidicoccus mucosus TaxID=1184151 RepID=UPI00318468E9
MNADNAYAETRADGEFVDVEGALEGEAGRAGAGGQPGRAGEGGDADEGGDGRARAALPFAGKQIEAEHEERADDEDRFGRERAGEAGVGIGKSGGEHVHHSAPPFSAAWKSGDSSAVFIQ